LQEKEVKLESAEERANEFDESTVWQTCKDSPWAPCGLPATGNFDAFTPVGGLSTPPGVSKIQAPTSSHIEERYDSRMTKVETDVNQILMMVSNLQKTIENSASAQASPQTQKTTSPATPETVIKIVPQDWMPEARELPYPCMERAPATYIAPRGEKVTLAPVKDVKRKKEEEIDDIHDVLRLWTRKLSGHCKEMDVDAQGRSIWVLKALEAIEKGGNLHAVLKRYNKADVDDPADVMNWTWARFKQCLYSSTLAKGIDPLKYEDAMKAIECAGTSKEDIDDFKDAFENAFEDYEADERSKPLGSSDDASRVRSMFAAQWLYNKCPPVLQSIMDDYEHNKERYGKRTDLLQMYDDLDKVKTNPLIPALLAAAAPQKSINASAAHSTYSHPDKSRIGTKDDYVVVLRVDDARTNAFETELSKLVASDQNFKWRRLPKLPTGDKTSFIVVHPKQSVLEQLSASSTCGAKPTKLGVVLNIVRSKEEKDAILRGKDKDKASSKQEDDGGMSSAGQSASHREEVLVQLMQEVRDALKSNAVNPNLSCTANSAVSSVIGPDASASQVGSTIIAQAALSGESAVYDNRQAPERDCLNFKMPGSGNMVANSSIRSNVMRTPEGRPLQFHPNLLDS
jgi:hypothetical protein